MNSSSFFLTFSFPEVKKTYSLIQPQFMKNNYRFSFLAAIVFLLSALVFSGGAYYLQDVDQGSTTVLTVLRSSHADFGGQSYYKRFQFTPRERDILVGQIKTELVRRDVVRSKVVVLSQERIDLEKAGRRTRIRGKNISIVTMRVGGRTVSMDKYVEGTRR